MTKTDELIKKSIKEYLQTYSEQIVHANIDFLEEIICGYLETKEFQCLKEQIKKDEIIKGLSGEKIEDIPTFTSTEYSDEYLNHLQKQEAEFLNRFDLWVKRNKAGYHYNDVHNSIVEYFKVLSIIDKKELIFPSVTEDWIEEEEYHEIHDDIIEARRNGEIE
jgi:hypothetical protein